VKSISRRTVLRGIGATIALPFLDAMYPAFAAQAIKRSLKPVRTAFLYVPNGIMLKDWNPAGGLGVTPLGAEFPRITAPLVPFRDDVLFLGNLAAVNGRALGDGAGDHARAAAAYLTGVHPKKTQGKDIKLGVSVDQIMARHFDGKMRFASMEFGCEAGLQGGACDSGYSCAYSNSISWRGETTPNPVEVSPRGVFERMFGAVDDDKDPNLRARLAKYRRSILDNTVEEAQRFSSTLGGSDRRKLDEYLQSIRDVEQRIQSAENANKLKVTMDAPEASMPATFDEHSHLMFDLMVLAFQTDMTRVVTNLLALEQSWRNYPEIGIPEAHHGLTHHSGDPEKIEKVVQINAYHLRQFTYLVEKMKNTPDGDGSLLDHSMIVYGSGLGDGNGHLHHDLPTVVAGKANGALKPGRHIRYGDETPITNLYLSVMDIMGLPMEHFGDSTGKLEGLSDL